MTFCMRISWWILKARNTHSEYVIIIIAFPLQQWLKKCSCMLRYTYVACLVEWCRGLWIQYWLWHDGRRILCISWSRNSMCYSLELSALLYLKWQTQLEMSRCRIRSVKRFRTCVCYISDFYSTWLKFSYDPLGIDLKAWPYNLHVSIGVNSIKVLWHTTRLLKEFNWVASKLSLQRATPVFGGLIRGPHLEKRDSKWYT
jgi:hypothetical protein